MARYNIVHEAVLYLMIDITITLTKIPRSLSNRRRPGHSNPTWNSEQLNSNVSRLFDGSDLETSRVAVEFRAFGDPRNALEPMKSNGCTDRSFERNSSSDLALRSE